MAAIAKQLKSIEDKVNRIVAMLDIVTETIENQEEMIKTLPERANEQLLVQFMQMMSSLETGIVSSIKNTQLEAPKQTKSRKSPTKEGFVRHPDYLDLSPQAFVSVKSFVTQVISKHPNSSITVMVFPDMADVLALGEFSSKGAKLSKDHTAYLQKYAKGNVEIMERAGVAMKKLNTERLDRTIEKKEDTPSEAESCEEKKEAN
jgi:hypothetical protein